MSTAALSPSPAKIAKLIPMLGTNHDGEVVATVRAIERALRSDGLDFHALAKAACDKPSMSWADASTWCKENDKGRLNDKERAFVVDMSRRLRPSEKQAAWLSRILEKLREAST